MSRVEALARFVYDFVVGDDPLLAGAVVVALGVTAAVARGGIAAWWIVPCAVIAVLALSLARATRA